MVALVRALAAILFGQLDTFAFNLVHRADVDAIGADYFHVFSDFAHRISSVKAGQRARASYVRFPTRGRWSNRATTTPRITTAPAAASSVGALPIRDSR